MLRVSSEIARVVPAGRTHFPVYAPSWFTGEPANRYQEIPGTASGTLLAANASLPTNAESFSGMGVDPENLWFSGGGHALQSNNAVYQLPLIAASTAWVKVMNGSSDTTGDFSSNGAGSYTDGSKVSDHTYGTHVALPGGATSYFGMIGGGWDGGASFGSSISWKWRLADITNGRHGYTSVAKAHTGSTAGFTFSEGVGCFDSRTGKIWIVASDGHETPNPVWAINTNTDTIEGPYAPYSTGGNFGASPHVAFCAIVPKFNVLVIGTDDNTIITMSLDTPGTYLAHAVTGTFNTGTRVYPMVYSPAANQLLGRMAGDGNSVRYVTAPDFLTGTWAAGTSSAAGGGDSPGDPVEAGPYGRWNIIPNFGNTTHDLLLYWPNAGGAVYFQRITGPRS